MTARSKSVDKGIVECVFRRRPTAMAIVVAAAIRRDVFAIMLTGLVALASMDIAHRGYPQRRKRCRRQDANDLVRQVRRREKNREQRRDVQENVASGHARSIAAHLSATKQIATKGRSERTNGGILETVDWRLRKSKS